jgi:choline dehydrogenase-like flavoprotein
MTEAAKLACEVDVLVVGSGPAGSAVARRVFDTDESATILMVDAGPALTPQAGTNTRNLRGAEYRAALEPVADPSLSDHPLGPYLQPGTHLLRVPDSEQDLQADMPAAAMSTNVGGMGAHWSCACPPPGDGERIPVLDRERFDAAFADAIDLLAVTNAGFARTSMQDNVERVLSGLFDSGRTPDRRVQPMPLACRPGGLVPDWTGVHRILGARIGAGEPRFTLRGDTLCRTLLHQDGRVHGAELEHRPSGTVYRVRAGAVVVAADTLRTPRLLWASGIRPAALGRYLNDQPMIVATVAVDPGLVGEDFWARTPESTEANDHLRGVTWVPYDQATHPFHGQIHYFDPSFTYRGPRTDATLGPFVVMSWFLPKDIRAEDRVLFSETDRDRHGLPAISIRHRLTTVDEARIADAVAVMAKAAAAIGHTLPDSAPRLYPSGSSLHYQGTVRMGAADDGTSVCDNRSRVWGTRGLYVAGNGVIPTSTACNPTATSMALAILAADDLGMSRNSSSVASGDERG